MNRKLGSVIMLLGVAAFAAATLWWFSFFYEVLGDEFQVARECFYWTTDICALKAPATLFADVPEYEPAMMWIGVGMFALGILIRALGSGRR